MVEPRLLVVKLADMGDLLTATPALRALRESFPTARLEALITPHTLPLLTRSPLVDEVITFPKARYDSLLLTFYPPSLLGLFRLWRELRRRRYDKVIILHHLTTLWGTAKYAALALSIGAKERVGLDNGRGFFLTRRAKDLGFGGRHEVEYWLEVVGLLGAGTEDKRMQAPFSEEDEREVEELLQGSKGSPLVALHPGSGGYSPARRWPPERFAQVADGLIEEYGVEVALVGGPEEGRLTRQVASLMSHPSLDLGGRTSLPLLAALLRRCHLFVGNDSGVMHLAAAVGTPVVAIFGPSNPSAWGPWGVKSEVVRVEMDCSPCFYRGFRLGRREGCHDPKCMDGITPEMVLAAVERLGVLKGAGEGGR